MLLPDNYLTKTNNIPQESPAQCAVPSPLHQCLQECSWVSSSQITYGQASKHQLRFSERKAAVCCWVFSRILPWAGLQKYRRTLIRCLQISISLIKCFINNIILPRNMDKKVVKHTLCQLRLFFVLRVLAAAYSTIYPGIYTTIFHLAMFVLEERFWRDMGHFPWTAVFCTAATDWQRSAELP